MKFLFALCLLAASLAGALLLFSSHAAPKPSLPPAPLQPLAVKSPSPSMRPSRSGAPSPSTSPSPSMSPSVSVSVRPSLSASPPPSPSTLALKKSPSPLAPPSATVPALDTPGKPGNGTITFVFGIWNINRKQHMGKDDLKFEDDYIPQLNGFLEALSGFPIVVFCENKYRPFIKSKGRVEFRFVELSDLRKFPYYDRIEYIRVNTSWVKNTPWLSSAPQGYSDLYNPIVMQKIVFTHRVAEDNPFHTDYFVWLDSGGICAPHMYTPWRFDHNIGKLKYRLATDRFFVTRSPYFGGAEVHGCHQRNLHALIRKNLNHVCKGWIMGGSRLALDRMVVMYHEVLRKALNYECLGTEETVLALAYELQSNLFVAFNNSEPYDERADNVCKFVVEPLADEEERQRLGLY